MMRCDVLVIGGGPAGASAALLLARRGHSVIVVEKAEFPRRKVCGEFIAAAGIALLRDLGLGASVAAAPDIRRIAVWAGAASVDARMPAYSPETPYPRALSREKLDALLLRHATRCGARVLQPTSVLKVVRDGKGALICQAATRRGERAVEIEARAVVAAHGSWEPGELPTQPPRLASRVSDLLGFKAHFEGGDVPPGTIGLAPFRGGYAGLVGRGGGLSTFACCVSRGALDKLRASLPATAAGECVLRHAMSECAPLRRALRSAGREGAWLAVGPLRPGARPLYRDGIFAIGNAAGEAHPVVGEGIAMAMQSAVLLSRSLDAALVRGFTKEIERAAARAYARSWRRQFAFRLRASAAFARLAMLRWAPVWVESFPGFAPRLLTLAASLKSGTSPG
jgi:flavin-dependent dehydrogenase